MVAVAVAVVVVVVEEMTLRWGTRCKNCSEANKQLAVMHGCLCNSDYHVYSIPLNNLFFLIIFINYVPKFSNILYYIGHMCPAKSA